MSRIKNHLMELRDMTQHVVDEIRDERARQIEDEGWTAAHDDEYIQAEMAAAAACYALACAGYSGSAASLWPWKKKWWKPTTNRRNLIKAAALIVAEIERLDRAAEKG